MTEEELEEVWIWSCYLEKKKILVSFLPRMLDDFRQEIETTESRMDNVMKKMAKVLHMSSGKYFFFFLWQTLTL